MEITNLSEKILLKDYKISIIRDVHEFEKLRDSWSELVENSETTKSVFQTFGWNFQWWNTYGSNKSLLIILIFDRNKLIGIMPLFRERFKLVKFLCINYIRFIGHSSSDYHDFIIRKNRVPIVMKLFDIFFRYSKIKYSSIELDEIPSTSPTIGYLQRFNDSYSKNFKIETSSICPQLPIPDNFENYNISLSRKSRKNLRRELRELKSKFKINLLVSQSEASDDIEKFIKLSNKSWSDKLTKGPFGSSYFRKFHWSLCQDKHFSKNIQFFKLYLDEELVSMLYTFNYKSSVFYYQIGYNPDFKKFSIGRMIIYLSIKHCIEAKINVFDFLRGQEEYKYRFGVSEKENKKVIIINKSLNFVNSAYKLYVKFLNMEKKNV